MGQKDITEKMLADYNDVFADIVNGLLFYGTQVVQEDDLENTKDKSQYKADDGKIHEEERDISKIVKNKNIRISLVGLEHQTDIDPDEPLRVIGYDGAAYRSQMLQGRKERYPVAMFKSDFRIVADYFVQTRMNKDYIPSQETITHVDEMLKLMSVLTDDSRFEEAQQSLSKGGAAKMCDVLDKVEARGIAKGKIEGAVKVYYLELKYSAEQIAEKLHLTTEEVENVISSLEEE